ncbi:MAG: alpha/beta fold hydrolase [Candidatus Acidiferrum sp.]
MTRTVFVLLLLLFSVPNYGQNSNSQERLQSAPSGSPALHPPGGYVTVNGIRLWYESEGSGQAVVLVPAGPGVPHSYFHPHFSALAKSYRVIYYDAFGTGKSDRASGQQTYTFARDVENLEGLRKALGLGKIDVLGHSYGGMVAQAYALRYPESVQKLILADSSWGGEMSQAHRDNALYELRNQYPETYERVMKIHREGFHTCSKQYRDADDAPPGFLLFYDNSAFQKLIKTGEPPDSEVLCAIDGDDGDFVPGPQMAKLDFHTQLKDLKMPVLILSGRFDRGMLPRYAVQFKTYAPKAEFVMFEKSGHFPFIEEPEEFIRIVSHFLRK